MVVSCGLGQGRRMLVSWLAGPPAAAHAHARLGPHRPLPALAKKLLLQRFGPPRRGPLRSVTSLRGDVSCRAAQPAPHPAASMQPRLLPRVQARPAGARTLNQLCPLKLLS